MFVISPRMDYNANLVSNPNVDLPVMLSSLHLSTLYAFIAIFLLARILFGNQLQDIFTVLQFF